MKESLNGKNIIVYDAEIKRPIEECSKGWKSYDEMGVSVACAYDFRELRFRVFMDDNLHELVERLNEPGTLIVAFNQVNFDNKLLRATPNAKDIMLKSDKELNNYDMLLVSKKACLGNERAFQKGFKLDDHLKAMDMPVKTGDGALAPIWWQEGKIGKCVDYCLNDAKVETKLFIRGWNTGKFACAYQRTPYEIELPQL